MNELLENTTAIIVVYRSNEVIFRCLEGIKTLKKIIIDNGNDKNLKDQLTKKYKNLDYVILTKNIGFGSAANIGIKKANTTNILLVTPDIIFQENSVINLFNAFNNYKNIGLVAPQVFDQNNKYLNNHCYSEFKKTRRTKEQNKIHSRISETRPDGDLSTDFITGAIFFAKKNILLDVGLFDENFFLYSEDSDLCYRIREKKLLIIETPSAKAIHPNNDFNRSVILNRKINFKRIWNHKYSNFYFRSKYQNKLLVKLKSIFELLDFVHRVVKYILLMKRKNVIINIARIYGILIFLKKN